MITSRKLSRKATVAKELKWYFSENPDGSDRGFHDAGIETFRENSFGYIARETIQNSLDAHKVQSKPVEVRFELKEIATSDIPDIASLKLGFRQSKSYWPKDVKANNSFDKSIAILRKKKITVLHISDHNTTGLHGSDKERGTNWHSLIRCFGASSKSAGEGGSFGIGSSAPFAASQLRTVLYSTMTGKSKYGFVGVARLTTHENESKTKVNPNGYLGCEKGSMVSSIRDIPKHFRRNENGTSLYILGLVSDEDWETAFKLSVIESFWPAIHFKKLVVKIGKETINKNNIEKMLIWALEEHKCTAIEYYYCLTESETVHVKKSLKSLKGVELHLRKSDNRLPKKVAMIRKPGMIVFHKAFRSPVSFCGVFRCENATGNQKLREMEPPRHDAWNGDLPERGENKLVERELMSFIRTNVKELTKVDDNEALDVPDLGRFLPDNVDSDRTKTEADESGDTMPENAEIPTSPIGSKPSRTTAPDLGDLGPDPDTEDDDNSDGSGGDSGSANEGSNKTEGDQREIEVAIESRAFSLDGTGKKYSLVLRPSDHQRHTVNVAVKVVGEEKSDPVKIASAKNGTKQIRIDELGRLASVALYAKKPTAIELVLVQPRRVSLEVIANEN